MAPEPQTDRKSGILIVDDEEHVIASLRRLLRRESYRLFTATEAAEALAVLDRESVDLVITDYRMPGMNGIELLKEIHRRRPSAVRILLTGYTEVSAVIAAINDGAIYKFLTKPWNDEELKLNIRRAIEQSALEAENQRMAREIMEQNEKLRELNQRLHQQAEDASTGLSHAHDIMDLLPVAALVIDPEGLVVWANHRAGKTFQRGEDGVMGAPASQVFSEKEYAALLGNRSSEPGGASGLVESEGRSLQWFRRPIDKDAGCQGDLLIAWEHSP